MSLAWHAGAPAAAGRRSLERLLPFYLQGLAAAQGLPVQGATSAPKLPQRCTLPKSSLFQSTSHAAAAARPPAALVAPVAPPAPRPLTASSPFADIGASSFWGRGKTRASVVGARKDMVRRSKTMDDMSSHVRRDPWGDSTPPASSARRIALDDSHAEEWLPTARMDLASHGMLEFEEMMARRVVLLARDASLSRRPQ
jgi:hypothetical protein